MSAVKFLPPPPTYSRLFRPWDGKTNQDNTITSTTQQANNNLERGEAFPRSESAFVIPSDSKCDVRNSIMKIQAEKSVKDRSPEPISKKIKIESPGMFTTLSPERTGKQDVPSSPLDYLAPQFYPANPYNDFLLGGTAAAAAPYIGIDPFLGSMEQEYARVLAEEAQMKMMTSRKQRPKKFKCPHCDVAFSNNGQLKGHIRIHTGKKHWISRKIDFYITDFLDQEGMQHYNYLKSLLINSYLFLIQASDRSNATNQIVEKHLRETKSLRDTREFTPDIVRSLAAHAENGLADEITLKSIHGKCQSIIALIMSIKT